MFENNNLRFPHKKCIHLKIFTFVGNNLRFPHKYCQQSKTFKFHFVFFQVCLLLKHRADHRARNSAGDKALDLAVKNSDADIVTLLRLAELNEEIRAEETYAESSSGSIPGDDNTFLDVVQEFSQMVYTHPERLHKK